MQRLHAVILLIAASAALAFDFDLDFPSFNDVIVGPLNRQSVLIFSGPINGTSFEWRGHNQISRFEIRQPNPSSQPQAELRIRGGIFDDFLQFWSTNGAAFDATVKIFSEPQNFTIGRLTANSELVHTERLSGAAPLHFSHLSHFGIAAIELWDRTNGTGAYVAHADGLAEGSVSLVIGSLLLGGRIDFEVRIFVERSRPRPTDMALGQLRNGSVLIETVVLRTGDVDPDGFFAVTFQNYTIDLARFTDLSNGAGGGIHLADINENDLWAWFDIDARSIVYLLEVYGQRTTNDVPAAEQAITVGELRPSSVLLQDIGVDEFGAKVTVVRRLRWPIDRVEVRNAGSRSTGVRAQLLSGEVGGSLLVVVFETGDKTRQEEIRFTVKVWGSEPQTDNRRSISREIL